MEGSVCLEKFGEVEVGTLGKKQPIEKKKPSREVGFSWKK